MIPAPLLPADPRAPAPAALRDVTLAYGARKVLDGLSLTIPAGAFTAVVGPNGCGKSTLLRVLGGALAPSQAARPARRRRPRRPAPKAVARRLAYLPQDPQAPELITVRDLVARAAIRINRCCDYGSEADAQAVDAALADTELTELAQRPVQTLSGGQRQRVWLALVLAQDTGILLLDEPTTFPDIRHQLDLLDLCARLHAAGRTLVVVLHDLNLAFRYASRVIMMRDGRIAAQGAADEVVTEAALRQVFDLTAGNARSGDRQSDDRAATWPFSDARLLSRRCGRTCGTAHQAATPTGRSRYRRPVHLAIKPVVVIHRQVLRSGCPIAAPARSLQRNRQVNPDGRRARTGIAAAVRFLPRHAVKAQRRCCSRAAPCGRWPAHAHHGWMTS